MWCLPVGHSDPVVALFFTVLFIIYLKARANARNIVGQQDAKLLDEV